MLAWGMVVGLFLALVVVLFFLIGPVWLGMLLLLWLIGWFRAQSSDE